MGITIARKVTHRTVSRSLALLEPAEAGQHFRQALAAPAELPPFWRARTELLYGQWLRRQRRRQDARRHLRAAIDLFHQLRAQPWEDRAAAELRATGETTRTRGPSPLGQLTPQEQHIAELVADGLTNAEIAARLFLSPRTIDYHLRKAFTKLGITSRTELARRVLPSTRWTEQQDRRFRRCEQGPAGAIVEACSQTHPAPPAAGSSRRGS